MSALHIKIRANLSNKSIYGIILFVIFGISLALRVSLSYENVFMGDWVRFAEADPWYSMRLVDNLMQHFPYRIAFDPFTYYPYGQTVPFAPFFDMLLGSVIWIIGLGSPTQNVIDTAGAYFPAILGALVTVPVYFIGRELFNRNAGLLAAGLIAILPGQFYARTMLGFTDHHAAETLFSTTAALFLILAIKSAKEMETSFSHITHREWNHLTKPVLHALLAGTLLGMYLDSWIGGLYFVGIIVIYMVIQYIIDHMRGNSTDYLCIIGVPLFLITLILVIPFYSLIIGANHFILVLSIAMFAILLLSGISRLMVYKNIKRAYYPVSLAGLGLAGLFLIYFAFPSLYEFMLSRIHQIFFPGEVAQTIGEVRPLLSAGAFIQLIYFFTTSFIFAFIALGYIIYNGIRKRVLEEKLILLVVWSILVLLTMFAQNRFAYYFAVNVALLSGYMCWNILKWSWIYFREALPEPEIRSSETRYNGLQNAIAFLGLLIWDRKGFEKVRRRGPIKSYFRVWHGMAGVSILVFLIAFVPNIGMVIFDTPSPGPNEAWYSSLIWMREHTPDPFEDPDYYYELYEKPPEGEIYDYPESAYGIMNLWDMGHWITRIAQRIPNANPFQSGASTTAHYFIRQDESSANDLMEALGSKYVILDHSMATGLFSTIVSWGGADPTQYTDVYNEVLSEESTRSIRLYYPEYYRSMCSRLYNFGGKAVVPHNSTYVISYEETTSFGTFGTPEKNITSMLTFATYEEAEEFVLSQAEPNYLIVGMDPFTSPVPLEELEHYRLVHQSDPESDPEVLTKKKAEPLPYVKIFEYIP